MQSPNRFTWAAFLPSIICCSLKADESPELPEQYAQVVLRVEGMI